MGDVATASSICGTMESLCHPIRRVLCDSLSMVVWRGLIADVEDPVDRVAHSPIFVVVYLEIKDRGHPSLDKFLDGVV